MSSTSPTTAPKTGLVIAILVLASSTSIMSTDMYSPSLPDLATLFDTSPSNVELTISLNFIAFGLAQFFHGPLSDRFGRRPVLMVSLLCVSVFSLLCAMANTIEQLIAARVLLGLSAAAEAVIGLAIIKDWYSEKQQVKLLAVLGMVIAMVPAVAPIAGGFIHVHLGWETNFYIISALAVFSVAVISMKLPESTVPDKQALRLRPLIKRYLSLLRNNDFMIHTLMLGIAMGLVLVFVTGAPFVLIVMLGVAPDHFGYYQAAMVVSFFLGSVVAAKLADLWPGEKLMLWGGSAVVVGALLLILIVNFSQISPASLTMCFCIITFGLGPLFAVAPSRALRSIDGNAGTASAMLSGLEQTSAGIAAVAISLLNDGTEGPMAMVTSVLVVLLIVLMRQSMKLRNP